MRTQSVGDLFVDTTARTGSVWSAFHSVFFFAFAALLFVRRFLVFRPGPSRRRRLQGPWHQRHPRSIAPSDEPPPLLFGSRVAGLGKPPCTSTGNLQISLNELLRNLRLSQTFRRRSSSSILDSTSSVSSDSPASPPDTALSCRIDIFDHCFQCRPHAAAALLDHFRFQPFHRIADISSNFEACPRNASETSCRRAVCRPSHSRPLLAFNSRHLPAGFSTTFTSPPFACSIICSTTDRHCRRPHSMASRRSSSAGLLPAKRNRSSQTQAAAPDIDRLPRLDFRLGTAAQLFRIVPPW